MVNKSSRITFSEHNKLNKLQFELDFVDVPVDGKDIELFIDPYSISKRNDIWYQNCASQVYSFFDHLLELIRLNNKKEALKLLNGLHESNETRLGYSPRNKGAAIGDKQSERLYESLKKSKAVETGILKDIEECNLMIPGIDRDKISDITTNIIKSSLISYTQEQCNLHNIKTYPLPVKYVFNHTKYEWENDYYNLPKDIQGKAVILVPKSIVRIIPALNAEEYYRHHILNYIQAEHYSAGSSLCQILKNNRLKEPSKKVIEEEITGVGDPKKGKKPLKEFVYEFTLKNKGEVLADYELIKKSENEPLSDEVIEKRIKRREQNYDDLIKKLKAIPPGKADASNYHNLMIGISTALFSPSLSNPKKETPINEETKRIDIKFTNSSTHGFFSNLKPLKGIYAAQVMLECKNYTDDLDNPAIDQLAMRFGPKRSQIGFLLCRTIKNRPKLLTRCRAVVKDEHGWIIPLTDKDIIKMLKIKKSNDAQKFEDYLEDKLAEITD